MKIAVVDDDKAICEAIAQLITNQESEAEVCQFSSGKEMLETGENFAISFLDIAMEEMSGLELAGKLRQEQERKGWVKSILIFITGYREYMEEAFDVNAFHYLVKPIDEEKFSKVFRRAWKEVSALEEQSKKYIVIKNSGTQQKIYLKDIYYIESSNKKVIYHTKNGRFDTYGKMEELEKEYDSAFDMYDRLAAYYEENDYNSVQHKRSARYEILLNYVRKYHKEKEDLFREVLTYDYYLRENAKSRPGFAGEYPVTKDVARAFYETEEETHEYLTDYGKYDRNQMRKMTHLEYFKLTDTYILFDYQNRNPLNQEARVCKIEKIKL